MAYLYLAGVAGSPDQLNMGDRRGAIEYARAALSHIDRIAAADPSSKIPRLNRPLAAMMLAHLLSADGASRQAADMIPEIEGMLTQIRSKAPGDIVADFDEGIARVWQRIEKHDAAMPYLDDAVDLRRRRL